MPAWLIPLLLDAGLTIGSDLLFRGIGGAFAKSVTSPRTRLGSAKRAVRMGLRPSRLAMSAIAGPLIGAAFRAVGRGGQEEAAPPMPASLPSGGADDEMLLNALLEQLATGQADMPVGMMGTNPLLAG